MLRDVVGSPRRRLWGIGLVAALVLVGWACGSESEPAPASNGAEATATSDAASTPAPASGPRVELTGINGWLNSEPLAIGSEVERGQIVLVDFWTYTCINCIRTLPFVEAWHERYGDHGLTVIGVHTPEFDFERRTENVQSAIEEYGLGYAVAQDNDYATWRAFNNHFWPAKYLIGLDGRVIYSHFGEGAYDETELAIRRALAAAGHDLDGVEPIEVRAPELDPSARRQTSELYAGYEINYAGRGGFAGQADYYLGADEVRMYTDDGTRDPDRWYLQGAWRNEAEAIVHARESAELADYLAIRFIARSVNVVLSSDSGATYDVVVELDGRALAADEAGADVTFDADGRSIVTYDGPRMYHLVELPSHDFHELRLRSASPDLAIHAFTFGSYLEGA
ncbi:MAG: redoxin domain-containing protein [Dehalococcoidia bacterium]